MTNFLKNVKKYHKYMYKNALSELKSEVSGSYLSWLWWFIEPCAFMAIYALVFGAIFENNEQYFLVFVLLGLTSWQFFQRMLTCSVGLISRSKELITKVYVPKYVLLISKSYVYLFKMAISLLLAFIIMIGYQVPLSIYFLYIFLIIPFLYIVTFGFCTILMHYGVYLGDLNKILDIVLKLVFYLSGIFYNITDRIDGDLGKYLYVFNPVAISINEFRNVLLYETPPNLIYIGIWVLIGIMLAIIGIKIINKNENSYAKVV